MRSLRLKRCILSAAAMLGILGLGPALADCSSSFANGFEESLFEVEEAIALSANQVLICFNHPVSAATVSPDGQQFLFSGSLSPSSAAVSGSNVLVTTSAHVSGFNYTVTIVNSLTDTAGNSVTAASSTVSFQGF